MPHDAREKATAAGDLVEPTAGVWGGREGGREEEEEEEEVEEEGGRRRREECICGGVWLVM